MSEILIVVASRHGHTRKIASRIRDHLIGDERLHVDLCDDLDQRDPRPGDYDLVIAGASIRLGHHPAAFADWARRHAVALSMQPSAFFSVCLAVAEGTDEADAVARSYLDDLEDRTGWLPTIRTTFAGAVQYREYALPTRLLMQVKMRQGHHPADIGHDHDFTDWSAVEQFAHDCAALLAPARRELAPSYGSRRRGFPDGTRPAGT